MSKLIKITKTSKQQKIPNINLDLTGNPINLKLALR